MKRLALAFALGVAAAFAIGRFETWLMESAGRVVWLRVPVPDPARPRP